MDQAMLCSGPAVMSTWMQIIMIWLFIFQLLLDDSEVPEATVDGKVERDEE